MCYAIPAKIMSIDGDSAEVDYGGVIKKVNIFLIDGAEVGELVLVHAGFAIERMNKEWMSYGRCKRGEKHGQ